MAIVEIILGERPPTGVQTPIEYSVLSEDFCTTINGDLAREPVAPLRERFAKLKARDNLLGAVLARLGADPGARETEAHNVVERVLNAQAALEKISKGLGLDSLATHALPAQVLAMNTELTAALAKAQERVKELEGEVKGHQEADEELEELLSLGDHSDGVIATIKKMQARLSSLEAPPLGWAQRKIAKVGTLVGLENADLDTLHQGVKAALAKAEAKRDEAIAEAINECKGRAAAEAEVRDLTSALEKVRRELDEERLSTAAEIGTLTHKLGLAELDLGRANASRAGLAAELDALWRFIKDKLRT